MYIDPRFIHIYKTEILEIALHNPKLPHSLKTKIEYELSKRKLSKYVNINNNTNNTYYKLFDLENNLYLCLGVAEFYVSATPECYDL